MSAEWSTRDSLPPIFSCTEIFVWGNTDISAITFTVRCDPEVVTFLKGNWFMSAERGTLDSLRRFLSCTEICVRGNTDISGILRLQLTVTFTFDKELDFLKQNLFVSAEWSRLDSLPPFLCCTEICVRVITDISGIVKLN
jgi:hypothetical protein